MCLGVSLYTFILYLKTRLHLKKLRLLFLVLIALSPFARAQEALNTTSKDTINPISQNTEKQESITPIIVDFTIIDLPFSTKSIDVSGTKGLITNPSMTQSLNISSSFYSTTTEGLYRVMDKSPKALYLLASVGLGTITTLPVPLTSGWMHEEYHRAVLMKHGGDSYNDMNKFPINSEFISVSHVKDQDIVNVKNSNAPDMVRMSEAGIEGEYVLGNTLNNRAFFYNAKSYCFAPLLSAINSILYVRSCSSKEADVSTIDFNLQEGDDVKRRDLVGLDFLSYTYDLHRPDEPYQNRGIHPSGVGIDRYIKQSQLRSHEKSYLKQQGNLQLINLLNPISLWFTSFTISRNANGDDTRANIYFNHWLTSFGYDISTTGLLHYNKNNYAFTLHNYVNYYGWMPGMEVETYEYKVGANKSREPLIVSARAMVWLQPREQLFFSKRASLGGLIEAKIAYPLKKHFNPYISITAKTNGWVAGNVYLNQNISVALGVRGYF